MSTFARMIYGVIVITIWATTVGCSSDRKERSQQEQAPLYSSPAPVYEQPYYYPPATPSEPKATERVQEQQKEAPATVTPPIQPTVTISKYYEEGYDAGYDDGEDDAVSGNGWGGQFDDSCRYKGKAKKDYQLGYEEGYEAGYYDNKDGDE